MVLTSQTLEVQSLTYGSLQMGKFKKGIS